MHNHEPSPTIDVATEQTAARQRGESAYVESLASTGEYGVHDAATGDLLRRYTGADAKDRAVT